MWRNSEFIYMFWLNNRSDLDRAFASQVHDLYCHERWIINSSEKFWLFGFFWGNSQRIFRQHASHRKTITKLYQTLLGGGGGCTIDSMHDDWGKSWPLLTHELRNVPYDFTIRISNEYFLVIALLIGIQSIGLKLTQLLYEGCMILRDVKTKP